MHNYIRRLISRSAALLLLAAVPAQAMPDWIQDLKQQQTEAIRRSQPVVVFFIGNGRFDVNFFKSEPLDAITTKARFVWVGPDLSNTVDPAQFAVERSLNVGREPVMLVLRRTGTTDTFHETFRCAITKPGVCAAAIVKSVQSGK
jgi:hypothetical protein